MNLLPIASAGPQLALHGKRPQTHSLDWELHAVLRPVALFSSRIQTSQCDVLQMSNRWVIRVLYVTVCVHCELLPTALGLLPVL